MKNLVSQMMENDVKEINLNRSQSLIHAVNANKTVCLWPRAGGKTTGGQGPRITRLSEVMPRSQVILFSDTFERLHDRIVPNIMSFITNEEGLIEDLDFVVFKKPPTHFMQPLIKLEKFDHVISFSTGFALCCASQKVSGSANGYNAQALIVDEAKFVKRETITTEVIPALRGAQNYFGHLPEYRSQWFFSDKWGGDIKWLQDNKKLMNQKLIDAVIRMQVELLNLQEEQEQYSSTRTIYKYQSRIIELENKLNRIRKELVFVSDADPYENLINVGEKYFRDLKRDLSKLEFDVAILNKDPDRVEFTFYPGYIPEIHNYKIKDDICLTKPITVALDYQWRITPLVAAQFHQLPGSEYTTLNIISAIDSLDEQRGGIDSTVDLFCKQMREYGYVFNRVNYVYDHTAIGKSPANDPFFILVQKAFIRNGWLVNLIYIAQASEHDLRFASMKNMFNKNGDDAVRFNQDHTVYLRQSIQLAETVSVNGKTKKDKSKEKRLSTPARETTDYSEALDQLLWAALELRLIPISTEVAIPITAR